jgi:peptidoglycan/LPS O-acetylase OafA/YrhL
VVPPEDEPDPAPRPEDVGARRQVRVLVVAAAVVAVEALVLLGVGVSVVLGGDRDRIVLDVTTTAFFLACGGGLLVCARGLLRARRWARAPVVLAQLIQVLVAWGFLPGQTGPVALLLAGAAVVVLVAVLSPPATRALLPDEPAR